MTTFFQQMGQEVESRWRSCNYDLQTFPKIASDILAEMRPASHTSYEEITAWSLTAPALPYQPNMQYRFGEPPLTVYWSSRFYIEILHWNQGSTFIHQHGFSGAFALLHGASIQTRYSFVRNEQYGPDLLLGQIRLRHADLLGISDVEPILGGNALIHAVFHYENPTVSVVLRTPPDPYVGPQYLYRRPFVAIDPLFDDWTLQRRAELIKFAIRAGSTKVEAALRSVLENADVSSAYKLVRIMLGERALSDDTKHEFVQLASKRVGEERLNRMLASFKEEARIANLTTLYKRLPDESQKWILALLMNVPDYRALLSLIATRYPTQEPERIVSNWLQLMLESGHIQGEKDECSRVLLTELAAGKREEPLLREVARHGFQDTDTVRRRWLRLNESPVVQCLTALFA